MHHEFFAVGEGREGMSKVGSAILNYKQRFLNSFDSKTKSSIVGSTLYHVLLRIYKKPKATIGKIT